MYVLLVARLSEFLTDSAERIIILKIIHRRILNRYKMSVLRGDVLRIKVTVLAVGGNN